MKRKDLIIEVISILFILLFVYAALNKIIDHEKFSTDLRKSPMFVNLGGIVSWVIPIVEITVSALLIFSSTRFAGLIASFSLMVIFSVYIFVIINFSEFVPCSCGGVLQKLSWSNHLIFNICFIAFGLVAVLLSRPLIVSWKIIASSTALTSLAVVVLFVFTYDDKTKYSSFDRHFTSSKLTPIDSLDLKYNSFYFAGLDSSNIYLGNETASLLLISVNKTTLDSSHILLSVPDSIKNKLHVKIKYPYFYLLDGVTPVIFRGVIGTWHSQLLGIQPPYFSESTPISSSSFAMRILSSETNEYELGRTTPNSKFIINQNLLQKQIDGRFCVDGKLLFNDTNSRLLYIYNYRNQFAVIDTNMNIVYYKRTVDTISVAKLNVIQTTANNYSLGGNAIHVNQLSSTDGDFLFINSAIHAKNEHQQESTSVIDIYTLDEHPNLLSFYIPSPRARKLREFSVSGNRLFALYGNQIFIYDISNILKEVKDASIQRDHKDITGR